MTLLAENSPILTKVKELCAEIASNPRFAQQQASIESFLNDDAARTQYQTVHEMGERLYQKQHAGLEPAANEIKSFENARDALFDNPLACAFMDAQRQLDMLQKEIAKHVGMTLELGRVPTEEDLSNGGGCCGGHGDCGCDDSHGHQHGGDGCCCH